MGAKVKTTPVSILGSAERAPVEVIVRGSELDSVFKFAEVVKSKLGGNPEVKVQVDRDKMSALGLNLQTMGATTQTAFNGNTNGKFQGEYEYDINIRLDNFNRKSINDARELTFINSTGQKIRLDQFATVAESSGPSRLERQDKSTKASVQAQVVGRPSGTIFSELDTKIKDLPRPAGVSYIFGGESE